MQYALPYRNIHCKLHEMNSRYVILHVILEIYNHDCILQLLQSIPLCQVF